MSNLIVFEAITASMAGIGDCVEELDIVLSSDGFTNIGICFEMEDGVAAIAYRHAIANCREAYDLVEGRSGNNAFGFCIEESDGSFATSVVAGGAAAIAFFAELEDSLSTSSHFFMVGSGDFAESEDRVRGGNFINGGFCEELPDSVSATYFLPYEASFIITQTPGYAHMEVLDDGIDSVFGISDTITISSQLVTTLRILLRESLRLQSSLGTQGVLKAMMSDVLKFNDRIAVLFMAMLEDTITMSDSISVRINIVALVDALILSGALSTVLQAKQVMASVLTLRDALDKKFVYTLDDDMTLSDELTGRLSSTMQLIDAMTLSDELTGTGSFAAVMSDTIELGDSMQTRMDAIFRMSDQLDLVCRLYTDNGERVAWAFNTVTSATTKYENYSFNSVAELDGVHYAASDTGFYAMGSDTDDGVDIDAYVSSGLDTLGSTYQKRMVKAYLHYRADSTMLVSYVTTESGVRSVETYRATPVTADDFRETNVDVPAGKKAVFWSFKISNENGGDFDLSGFYTIPLICGSRSDG